MKFGLASLQGVLYVNNFDLTDKLYVAQLLGKLKSLKFNNNPTILPLPPDAPLEVPRIILRTDDSAYSLNISPARIDLFYNTKKIDKNEVPDCDLTEIENSILIILKEISKIITTKFSVKHPRLALVANYLIKLEESSKKYILNRIIREGIVKDPKEIQLNFLMNKEISNYKINEWLRFNTLRNQKNLKDDTALLLTIDLNTIAEINYDFNQNSLDEFFRICFSFIKGEIKLYTTNKGEVKQ